jgi:hypothetical protein
MYLVDVSFQTTQHIGVLLTSINHFGARLAKKEAQYAPQK